MRRHKSLTMLVLGVGSLAGSALYRRRSSRRFERVELYAEDGSMASIADGSTEGVRLLALARDLIALAG